MLAKRHLILSTLIAVLLPLTSLAGWMPAVHHFSPADYSAGTQNWDMVQQANGWMYVANNYGLLETDGFSWHLYGIHNATAIRSVALGKDGAIYVGGTDEFGVFTPNELGELHYENLSLQIPERYRQFGEVWQLQVANDVLNEIRRIVDCLNTDRIPEAKGKIQHLQHRLARNGERTINWKRFEENFDIVNNQFITHLTALYPWMSKQERRMCVYIHIGLTSKEIAPLLNLSIRGAEMMRYRIRIKMNIDASMSLKQHLFEIQQRQTDTN